MHLRKLTILAALSVFAIGAHAQETMTITSYGGAYQASEDKAYFQPFSQKTGVKILQDEWNNEVSKLKAMVDTGQVSWDVVDVEPAIALQGCDEGWLEKIDYTALELDRNQFIKGSALDCAVGTIVFGTIYAYDVDKFPNGGPQTAADFWDVKKFPGPRSLRKSPKTTLEFALIADGVPTSDVYKVLSTPEGIERAFAKLDEIRPNVKVWWTAGAQPVQLLADGEVAMATAWNGRIFDAVKNDNKKFKIVWDGQALDFNLWAIPKGAKQLELSNKFIKFTMDPDVMSKQSQYISYGPTLLEATKRVPAAILADLPTAPENMKNAYPVSAEFWADHDEELTERFNNWLAK